MEQIYQLAAEAMYNKHSGNRKYATFAKYEYRQRYIDMARTAIEFFMGLVSIAREDSPLWAMAKELGLRKRRSYRKRRE